MSSSGEETSDYEDDDGFKQSSLFNSSQDGYGPLLILISFLDIRTSTEISTICASYGRTVKQFFKLTEEAANIYRPKGISIEEVKLLVHPKTGAGEILFLRLLHSHFIKNFKVSVEIDFNTYTLLEYACYRGYPDGVRLLLEKNFDRRYFNFGLEYGAYSGNLEVVKMLMTKPISTVYVNKSLQRAIDRKFYNLAAFMINDFRVCLNYKSSAHIRSIFVNEKDKIRKYLKIKKASKDAENKQMKEEFSKILMKRYEKIEEKRRKKEEKMGKRMSRTFGRFFSTNKGKEKESQKNKLLKKSYETKKKKREDSLKKKKIQTVPSKPPPENAIVNTRYLSAKQHRIEEKQKKRDEKGKRREERKRKKKLKELEEEEKESEKKEKEEKEKRRKIGKDDDLNLSDGGDEILVIDGGGYNDDAEKSSESDDEKDGEFTSEDFRFDEEDDEKEEDDGRRSSRSKKEKKKKKKKTRRKSEVKIRYETQTVIEKKIVIEKKFEQVPIPVVDYEIANKLKQIKKLQNDFLRDLTQLQNGFHELETIYDQTDESMSVVERNVDRIHETYPRSGKSSESERWKNKRIQRVVDENKDLRDQNRGLRNENHHLAKELRKQNNLVRKLRKTLKKISDGEAKRMSRKY